MKRLYLDYYFVKPNTLKFFLKLGCVQVATMNTISFYEFRLASRAIARTIKHMHSLKYKPIVFSCNIDNAFHAEDICSLGL